ncbi:MAG: nucleotidyltransferase family protein [Oscillospiraceae bacterium]|jgi:predicted nucleotidyltransferase|nr:nucleotidyltransferase family protein [Oscillospiraceae bacterium]
MLTAGIIAEYSPFHKGHAYHIQKTRELGASHVVVCMSGNFTQRGEASPFDKFARADAAIAGGADLVLELPLAYSLSSAEHFGYGGVSILNSIGCVDWLSFGSEQGNLEGFTEAAQALEDTYLTEKIKSRMNERGETYALSRHRVLSDCCPGAAELLEKPNNALGFEYIKWLGRLGSKMRAVTIGRAGAGHDSRVSSEGFASASYIRRNLEDRWDGVRNFIPAKAAEIFASEIQKGRIIDREKLDFAVLAKLRRMDSADFLNIADVGEGLENRISNAVIYSRDLNQLLGMVKTKRYTMSRVKRVIMNAFLDIPREMRLRGTPYIRALALNGRGQEILRAAKKTCGEYISASLADIRRNCPSARDFVDLEVKSTDIYKLCFRNPDICRTDFFRQVKKTDN